MDYEQLLADLIEAWQNTRHHSGVNKDNVALGATLLLAHRLRELQEVIHNHGVDTL